MSALFSRSSGCWRFECMGGQHVFSSNTKALPELHRSSSSSLIDEHDDPHEQREIREGALVFSVFSAVEARDHVVFSVRAFS